MDGMVVSACQARGMALGIFIDGVDLPAGPLFTRLEANAPMHGQRWSLQGSHTPQSDPHLSLPESSFACRYIKCISVNSGNW